MLQFWWGCSRLDAGGPELAKSLPHRRAIIVYEYKPSAVLRLKFALTRSDAIKSPDLGFRGIQARCNSKQIALKRSKGAAAFAGDYSLKVIRLAPSLYLLAIEIDGRFTKANWRLLNSPSSSKFSETFPDSGAAERIVPSTFSSCLFIDFDGQRDPDFVGFDEDLSYATRALAERIAITASCYQILSNRSLGAGFAIYSFRCASSFHYLSISWREAWQGNSRVANRVIRRIQGEFQGAEEMMQISEKLKLAVQREQRRIAWAGGTGAATGNLAASVLPDGEWKIAAVAISLMSGLAVYAFRIFSRV